MASETPITSAILMPGMKSWAIEPVSWAKAASNLATTPHCACAGSADAGENRHRFAFAAPA